MDHQPQETPTASMLSNRRKANSKLLSYHTDHINVQWHSNWECLEHICIPVLHTPIEVLDEPQGYNLENSIYLFANAHCYAHGLYVKDW